MKKCKYCDKEFDNGLKLAGHQTWCSKNPDSTKSKEKCGEVNKGKKFSKKTRDKISESRKRFLRKNPDMVPYKLNHKHKETYPEKYFKFVLRGFIYQYKVPGTLYEIDFANVDTKVAIEIDGEQHYLDTKILEHDKKRTKILEDLGWEIIRIRWSKYQKLNLEERKSIINEIMLNSMDPNKKIENYINFRKKIEDEEKRIKIKEREDWFNRRKDVILNSDINYSEYGWVTKVSKVLGITPQKSSQWIKKNMPEFYSKYKQIRGRDGREAPDF